MTPTLEKLINHFASLPGIGKKSAARLAYYVLGMKKEDVQSFADSLLNVKSAINLCKHCQSFCEREICEICSDNTRDKSVICVVEDAKSIDSIENLREYKGLYHVLHGVISPIDGIGPEQLKIKELLSRIDDELKEVIVATNPSVEGEATALYIGKILKPFGIKVTRLAYGLPVGATLEYADGMTLLRAIEGRTEVK
ncbi:MAG: recombination mediator RecR [Eubacteriales bacterium]|nr:recombination mediator RecR [Eubacteriales bacterium]MDD4422826.1 recombination mediator RecR [Eubacteriales bacterium]HBR31970.1 recombination protein RecR [Clostridiales bacterium]